MSRQSKGIPLECDDGDLTIGGTAVTSTAAELNILDGVTATATEINTACDGITATAAELNTLDGVLTGTVVWDPGSLAADAQESKDCTVTGAALGDYAIVGAPVDVTDLVVSVTVTAADTATIVLSNATAGAIDLASATWNVMVIPQ